MDHLGLEEAEASSAGISDDLHHDNSGNSGNRHEVSNDSDVDDDIDNQNGKEEEDFGLGSASAIRPPAGQNVLSILFCKLSRQLYAPNQSRLTH